MKRLRTLSGLLALCLLLTLLPVGAAATEETPETAQAISTAEGIPAEELQDPVEDPAVELAGFVTIPEGGRLRPVR